MSNNARDKAALEEHFADIFARLREQDIEQFYAHYQLWVLRRRVPLIEIQLDSLREHLAEHQQISEKLRPSALALAVLVRLQSNGVSDTDVLDLMLDRGEGWLDRMMQRLDYCEQVEDFIQGDYTQWCIKSLEGAYDWIDSLLGSIKEEDGQPENAESNSEATEELLLQKLSLDDEEAMLEATLELPATQPEAATASDSEIAAVDTAPASEPESIPLPDEHLSETRERSEPADQPEQILLSESPASGEIEQQPEIFGWKDLEDLEAPEGHPLPWYSVNVNEDGASSTSIDAEQAVTMDDWIKVLQADTFSTEKADEIAGETSSNLVETTAINTPATPSDHAARDIPTEAIAESVYPATNNPEVADLEQSGEVQGAPEAILPVTPEIVPEPNVPSYDETQPAGTSSDESAIPLAETGPIEVITGEASPETYEADEITSSAEDEDEQTTAESLVVIEEPELTEIEQETAARTLGEEAAEGIAAQTQMAEEVASDADEATDITDALPTIAQLAPTEDATEEHVAEQVPATEAVDAALSANEPGGQSEIQGTDLTPEIDKEAFNNEIETAAIVNDILGLDEGQEEQLPWYEYLELEEPANHVASSEAEAPGKSEEGGDTSPGEQATSEASKPEIYPQAIAGESVDEQSSTLLPEDRNTEEAVEIEGWQTWNISEGDDETQPLILKGVQTTHKQLSSTEQEYASDEPVALQDEIAGTEGEASETDETAENVSAGARLSNGEGEASQTNGTLEEASTEVEASTASLPEESAEAPVSTLDEVHEVPGPGASHENAVFVPAEASPSGERPVQEQSEPVLAQREGPTIIGGPVEAPVEESNPVLVYQHPGSEVSRRETVVEGTLVQRPIQSTPLIQAGTPSGKPPKKPGFWRRLFSFRKKSKR